jgi:hypothetical protein
VDRSLKPLGQVPRLGEHLDALEDEPGTGQVDERPFEELALFQALERLGIG